MADKRDAKKEKKAWTAPRLDRLGTISDVAGKPPPILQGSVSKS